jgi:diguanylate cyclase (GGDEF)-like protein
LIPAVALAAVWVPAAWPVTQGALTSLRAIHFLSYTEANKALPVAFEATVTYCRAYENTLFVQDGNIGIYARIPDSSKLRPGDRVLVQGTTHANFLPDLRSSKITVLRHGAVPQPVPATFDALNHAQFDSRLVTVHGVVRSADQVLSRLAPVISTRLQILTEGGDIEAYLDNDDPTILKDLLDAEVEVTGVSWGKFDGKYQLTGTNLYVSSMESVKVLKHASTSPWSLPVTPLDRVFGGYHVRELTPRARVQGTITYYQPGSALVLQNGSKSLWIMTQTRDPLQIGDLADATGFPNVHDGFLTLTHGEFQDLHVQAFVQPELVTSKQLTSSRHIFDLVSIEGEVVTALREAAQDEYVLVSDGYMFSAIYRHPDAADALPPMRQIARSSRVRVTGVCFMDASNPFDRNVPFNILLRSSDDIALVAHPSLLSVRNLIIMVGLLIAAVMIVGAKGWALERKVRRQASALAARNEAEAAQERLTALLEQQRSQILEDINSPRPLAEIIEQITAMVTFSLNGAPCWCEVADGAKLGQQPVDDKGLRIVCEVIAAHTGEPLGTLFAGFDKPVRCPEESPALTTGARLAALAIETRRLYTDLVYRSEFDTLTDIHNRYSLDRYLEEQIVKARDKASIFGLIYVDLDKFKQVNDLYGHHVGDLYLQEVTLRMKRQLRGADMLARLGGDEFAVLVPVVRSRVEVKEIALRLEHCFDGPFTVDDYTLFGSASVGIALYPEDGATADKLLSAADDAMYVAKNSKSSIGNLFSEFQRADLPVIEEPE